MQSERGQQPLHQRMRHLPFGADGVEAFFDAVATFHPLHAVAPDEVVMHGSRAPGLVDELGNVSRACKTMGYHCDTFYEVRRAFQTGGVAALVESKRGARSAHPKWPLSARAACGRSRPS